jgi:hypothetical protein
MSHLSSKTERKALKVIANTLRFFKGTNLLFVSAEDAFAIRYAEIMLKNRIHFEIITFLETRSYKLDILVPLAKIIVFAELPH